MTIPKRAGAAITFILLWIALIVITIAHPLLWVLVQLTGGEVRHTQTFDKDYL